MVEDGDEAQVAEEIQRVGQAVEDQVVAGGGTLEGAVQEALEAVGQRDQVGGWTRRPWRWWGERIRWRGWTRRRRIMVFVVRHCWVGQNQQELTKERNVCEGVRESLLCTYTKEW